MTTGRNEQTKSSYQEEISALLIAIEKERQWDQGEVEKRLGWSKNYISKAKGGHSPINKPLLIGLRLLKRVIELESAPAPETDAQKILRLEARLNSMESKVGVTYPAAIPDGYVLNDRAEKAWRAEFDRLAERLTPVTALRVADGAALDFENWGVDVDYIRDHLTGLKWLQHLEPGEADRLRAWLQDAATAKITYYGHTPHSSKRWRVTLKKKLIGPVAVCTGLAEEVE